MMNVCPNCDLTNRDGASFCVQCGTALAPVAAEPTTVMPIAAEAAALEEPPRRRSATVWLAGAAAGLAAVVIVGAGVWFLGSGDDGDGDADGPRSAETVSTSSSEPARTEVVATVPPAEVAPVPTAVVIATTTTTVLATTTTLAVEDTVPAPPGTPLAGDLGLAREITQPPCDGSYITVLASAVDPSRYEAAVGEALATYPGSNYLKTAETCSSLRPTLDGADIYVVFFGPDPSSAAACAARAGGSADAYVRVLSDSVPDTHRVEC